MSIEVGRRTLYELAIENGNRRILLAYCSNRGRRTVLDVMRKHGETLTQLAGTDTMNFAKRSGDGATIGAWRVFWTGRTQREAVDSKLPWIGDLKAEVAA
jgi:hypothetical protein